MFVVREVNQHETVKIWVWTLNVHDWLKIIQKHAFFILNLMEHVWTLWQLLKIKVKFENVCWKVNYEKMKNAKILALYVNL